MKSSMLLKFNGSEADLYQIAYKAWQMYGQRLDLFAAFNTIYTQQYGDDALAAVDAAKALPAAGVRRALPKNIRVLLANAADTGILLSLTLFAAIDKMFPADQVMAQKEAAGLSHYRKASHYNWMEVSFLLQAGNDYVASILPPVENGSNGLPPDFAAQFAAGKDAFDSVYNQYTNAKLSFTQDTTAKTTANNAVYQTLMGMLNDGKIILRSDKRLQEAFIYSNLKRSLGNMGKTGFRIQLQVDESLLPATSATVHMQPGNIQQAADTEGIIKVEVKGGTYTYTITTPGYETLSGRFTATTGTMHRKKFVLKKAASVAVAI